MKKPPAPPRRRHLSKEDEALWEHTAESLEPLRGKKSRHHPSVEEAHEAPAFAPKSAKKHDAGPKAAKSAEKSIPQPTPKTVPELNEFDRKAARRLRREQIEIEARIDLHGMRQHEAHVSLRRFLLSCSGRGLRWVLVITGKGGQRRQRDDSWGITESGVLRRNVPMWLSEPELRTIVVSFTTAAISHGGEGALYIQLRNPERRRP